MGTAVICPVCEHNAEHGWWGKTIPAGATHCRDCHRTWKAKSEGHCAGCHQHFAGSTFDAHQTRDRCLTADEFAAVIDRDGDPRFRLDENAVWRHAGVSPFALRRLASDREGTEA